ncbi:MAG: cation transporter [Pseudomonadales bacterium]
MNTYKRHRFPPDIISCAACPITVMKAMARVDGVESIEINFAAKTATAVFDPTQTNTDTIAQASSSVGFPARLKEGSEND